MFALFFRNLKVALLIWPNTNFHWIRMDAKNSSADVSYWSHKPGGTAVRMEYLPFFLFLAEYKLATV
jgi:hypothetical protein